MNTPVVKVSNLVKTYKLFDSHADRVKETFHPFKRQYSTPFNALEDVSFEIFKGETFGIVGKNGSGKSTLLQILSGVLQPTSGHVEVIGRATSLLELGVGFNPEFTGLDNIYLAGSILGFSHEEMESKIDEILAFADIGEFIHQPVKTYSSGMGVRLAFSIYSVVDPEIFIVDEALAVGDAYFVHRCLLRFNEMQEQGKTIILVSHDASSIKRLCKRALWLNDGKVQMIGDSSKVVDNYIDYIFKQTSSGSHKVKAPLLDEVAVDLPSSIDKSALPEMIIPNVDKRLGGQEYSIMGIGLYSPEMLPVACAGNGSDIILRISITNNCLSEDFSLAIGYIFRDFRGIEIASTHSGLEGVLLDPLEIGESATVQMKIKLPIIYPGSYSFSPSLSYIKNGEHIVCDRIMNAIILEVTSTSEMHVMMRFPTEVHVEQ